MPLSRSSTPCVKVCSQPMIWPAGHQALMYLCAPSVTSTLRKPLTSGGSSSKNTFSSFIRCRSKTMLPLLPLISNELKFARPLAKRVASKLPTAPFSKRVRNSPASSTVTSPSSCPPAAPWHPPRPRPPARPPPAGGARQHRPALDERLGHASQRRNLAHQHARQID